MIQHQDVKDLLNFLTKRRELVSYLQQIERGMSPTPEKITTFIEFEEKYKSYPFYANQIKDGMTLLRSFQNETAIEQQFATPNTTERVFPVASQIINQPDSAGSFANALAPTSSTATHLPTLQDIHNFYESQGIVGEHQTSELLIYALLGKVNVGIESLAGSGKSALLNATIRALPQKDYVTIHHATTGSLYANPKLQTASYLIIPELQKIFTPEIEEIIKNLAEGQEMTHTRTNANRTSIDTLRIDKKTILYSFAITNRHLQKKDEEFLRRFFILHTDISTAQNREILANYAASEFTNQNKCPPANQNQRTSQNHFQLHIQNCLSQQNPILNPYFTHLISSLPPDVSSHLKIRSTIKYLDSLIKGATRYYTAGCSNTNSVSPTNQQKLPYFSNITENMRVLELAQEPFINHLYGFDVIDRAVFSLAKTPRTLTDFKDEFYSSFGSSSLLRKRLESSLAKLSEENFISSARDISISQQLPQLSFEVDKAINAADTNMKQYYPAYRDEWYSKQIDLQNSPIIGGA